MTGIACQRSLSENERAPAVTSDRGFDEPSVTLRVFSAPGGLVMSHFPKPFFRKSRGLWYVQIKGQQVNLGPEKDEAFEAYHTLMKRPHEPAS
jgi:hypothetical protein